MSEWIFESPDRGKTIIRRLPHSTSDEDREIKMADGHGWMSIADLRKLGRQHRTEQALRDANPQLMELWKQYQVMLNLLRRDADAVE